MHSKNTYAVIGTGAVGGYCACKLRQKGFEVHCLLGHDYEHVRTSGITLIEDNSPFTAHVQAYNCIHTMPKCDVILLSTKSTANSRLQDLLQGIMHEKSVVVVLQNGIGMEEALSQAIEPNRLLGGSCVFKATKIGPGVVKHYGFCTIELAQYYSDDAKSEITDAVEKVAADLQATAYPHLPTIRWKKLVGNIASSGLSVVLNSAITDLLHSTSGFALIKLVTKEVIAAGILCGAKIPDGFYEERLQIYEAVKKMERHNLSMKDDFDAKKPLELDAIYKNPLQIARRHNVAMPLTEMIYNQLLYLEAQNR
jgi:2-dehydropantoate 2-reductase